MPEPLIEDTGIALSLAVILLGIALGLPHINLGIFGLDFSKFPDGVISILRLGIIGLAISIGLKPIEKDSSNDLIPGG